MAFKIQVGPICEVLYDWSDCGHDSCRGIGYQRGWMIDLHLKTVPEMP